jgi:FixJ family two-component response regulator
MLSTPDARVFVVDDDPAARESVAALVESLGGRATAFASGEEFLRDFEASVPSCLVADLRLGGMSGLDLKRELVHRGIALPVIVISAYADVPVTVEAMRSGVVTLLKKPYSRTELGDAIEEALQADLNARREQLRRRDVQDRLASLTDQEQSVVAHILEGKSNKAIAATLGMGLRTVEYRRKSLMEKLQVRSLVELVRVVGDARLPR